MFNGDKTYDNEQKKYNETRELLIENGATGLQHK